MSTSVFIEPLDVLLLRGNKLFGDPGSHGEALIPPWPSVAASRPTPRPACSRGSGSPPPQSWRNWRSRAAS